MALGRPVVSTSLGREGLNLRDEHEILTADDPGKFAGAVIRLLQDRQYRQDVAGAARKRVTLNYDWDLLAGRLLELYEKPSRAVGIDE
jgi:glycosyltransferase involved in cell wall biosynthesis